MNRTHLPAHSSPAVPAAVVVLAVPPVTAVVLSPVVADAPVLVVGAVRIVDAAVVLVEVDTVVDAHVADVAAPVADVPGEDEFVVSVHVVADVDTRVVVVVVVVVVETVVVAAVVEVLSAGPTILPGALVSVEVGVVAPAFVELSVVKGEAVVVVAPMVVEVVGAVANETRWWYYLQHKMNLE